MLFNEITNTSESEKFVFRFLDFSKASYTVTNSTIFDKLYRYGNRDNDKDGLLVIWRLVHNLKLYWLSCFSRTITSGIPRGPILLAILFFSLYKNYQAYAKYIFLYCLRTISGTLYTETDSSITSELRNISAWLELTNYR